MIATYNYWLVFVSLLVAILASYTALDLATRITASRGRAARSLARRRRVLDGRRHLVDALRRHARVPPAHPDGLRRADHAALDADRDPRLGFRALHREPRHAERPQPDRRRRADGARHLRHALHGHGGDGDVSADHLRPAALRRLGRDRHRRRFRRAVDRVHAARRRRVDQLLSGSAAPSSWASRSPACTTPAWRRRSSTPIRSA